MIHIFDGATGTMLQKSVLKPGMCPELLNIEAPEAIQNVHRAYVEAGSNIVETNTFGASRIKLNEYNLGDKVEAINIAAVKNAKIATAGKAKVAGSMGPTGAFIEPLGELTFDEVYENYYEQAKILADAGVDYILIETCIEIQEMRAALLAAKDACNLPVICQLSFSEDGRTVTGTDPQSAAIILEAMGADIIGANCSLGPEQLVPIIKELADNCSCPISVQANAGMPHLENGQTIFPLTPEDMAKWAPKLVEAGATYIGGCCGTTPAHIKSIKEALADVSEPIRKAPNPNLALASRSKTVFIGKDLPTRLIGERINPTGRKKLAEEIKNGSFISVKREAIEQTQAGAQILDVNMGVAGIDQAKAMHKAITEISQLVNTPLAIDTSDVKALEAGLKAYPGRALINSVSAEPDRLKYFIPLAKRYGAAILCLPLSDEGIPKTAKERLALAQKIIAEAKAHGLKDNDFLLDALVMTIAADKNACNEVLNTLKLYREHIGAPSTMGLSNISFGLPNRPLINSTFFTMCLAMGLDAPIMNPYDDSMQNALSASNALLAKDPNGRDYSLNHSGQNIPVAKAKNAVSSGDIIEDIKSAIISGEKNPLLKW